MPWCDGCERYWSPNALAPDGSCRRCGEVIAEDPPGHTDDEDGSWPWHLWLLVGLTTAYLLWRVLQGVGGLFG